LQIKPVNLVLNLQIKQVSKLPMGIHEQFSGVASVSAHTMIAKEKMYQPTQSTTLFAL